jgi:hypothetical protein
MERSSGFPIKTLYSFLCSHKLFVVHASYHPQFHHRNNIWWRVQNTQVLIMQLSLVSCSLPLLAYSQTPLAFVFLVRDQVSRP